jgi:hypothetical protein
LHYRLADTVGEEPVTPLRALAVMIAGLVACSESPVSPTRRDPSGVGGPRLAALATTTNEVIPIEVDFFVPCANGGAGEVVTVTGSLHVLSHVTTSNTGITTLRTHRQPQGVSGVGEITGDTYRGAGVTQETTVSKGPLPTSDTFIDNTWIIGQGSGNNLLMHTTLHQTVNANGEVTSNVERVILECR